MPDVMAALAALAWTIRSVRALARGLWLVASTAPARLPPAREPRAIAAAPQPEPAEEPVPALSEPVRAAYDLAAHTWPDGGMGHTGDLWTSTLTTTAMACGQYHSDVEAYCHREPRHRILEVEPDCQGYGANGKLYTWRA